jgi:hypothetical protein
MSFLSLISNSKKNSILNLLNRKGFISRTCSNRFFILHYKLYKTKTGLCFLHQKFKKKYKKNSSIVKMSIMNSELKGLTAKITVNFLIYFYDDLN